MSATKNTTGIAKFDALARDPRIQSIRLATLEECEGEAGAVMIALVDGVEHLTMGAKFLAYSVSDARKVLTHTIYLDR